MFQGLSKSSLQVLGIAVMAALLLATGDRSVAATTDHVQAIRQSVAPKVKAWVADPAVVSAVRAQNRDHEGLTQSEIDRLDKQWRAETKSGSRTLIDSILSNSLSKFLSGVKGDSQGLYSEVFVMDNKGLNAGQSDVTSDYWQGDEDKWKKTYLAGPDAILIGAIEFDESTQAFQSQLSLPVVDPDNGEVIGAVTVGVNVDFLQ